VAKRRKIQCASYSATAQTYSATASESRIRNEEARFNAVGVQQLSETLHKQLFGAAESHVSDPLVKLSKEHLKQHDLLGKSTDASPPVSFQLPPLQGKTLDEHFYRLGMESSEPYLKMSKDYVHAHLLPPPKRWVRRSGWTKYTSDGNTSEVDFPNETCLTFDTEVLYKVSPFAVIAIAASPTAWYCWLSPWLIGESTSDRHLVPLGNVGERLVVGHNIGYDRAKTLEEYDMTQTKTFWQDTMSMHVAVNGMCSQQRPTWLKHMKDRDNKANNTGNPGDDEFDTEEELWVNRSSVNSLREVAKFHCNVTVDKEKRDLFAELDINVIRSRLDELMDYCAADVRITHLVYKKVMRSFLEVCPHPVSFAALRHLSSVFLPTDNSWKDYITRSEKTYQSLLAGVRNRLVSLAEAAVAIKDQKTKYEQDPWLSQLDWRVKEVRYAIDKKTGKKRLALRQRLPGMPNWYKDLFEAKSTEMSLTTRSRIAPMLLRLSWEGHPLVWTNGSAWTFRVLSKFAHEYFIRSFVKAPIEEETDPELFEDQSFVYFKVPHKNGPAARCGNPLAKGYVKPFEDGVLCSEYPYAGEALSMNAACSYWISARERIMGQMVVWQEDLQSLKKGSKGIEKAEKGFGMILPQIIPMGTITRRAVENTWLTASNAKTNRVGSELKAMIRCPKGYKFVGADVDSEELWIASLIGDSQFGLHGGTALGWMTLEGTKAANTDLHSRTADILGISRNDAKTFNYGRIYGAGLRFAIQLLRQFNSSIGENEARETATQLYEQTKGTKTGAKDFRANRFWRGGTESYVFNSLEEIADQEEPRTPVLGASITQALLRRNINAGSFMTSRINWAIQSSGVDYLHLLIVSMDYLIKHFKLDARLTLTVHDEIRYLVKEEDAYKAAMALQISNLWTRTMFCQQVGIEDVPQSCAFFSAVDIDTVLRKEVDMDCVTPSNPTPIPQGESYDIHQLLEMADVAALRPKKAASRLKSWNYQPRKPALEHMHNSDNLTYLKLQSCRSTTDFKNLLKLLRKENRKESDPTGDEGEEKPYYREHQQVIQLPPHKDFKLRTQPQPSWRPYAAPRKAPPQARQIKNAVW